MTAIEKKRKEPAHHAVTDLSRAFAAHVRSRLIAQATQHLVEANRHAWEAREALAAGDGLGVAQHMAAASALACSAAVSGALAWAVQA